MNYKLYQKYKPDVSNVVFNGYKIKNMAILSISQNIYMAKDYSGLPFGTVVSLLVDPQY